MYLIFLHIRKQEKTEDLSQTILLTFFWREILCMYYSENGLYDKDKANTVWKGGVKKKKIKQGDIEEEQAA